MHDFFLYTLMLKLGLREGWVLNKLIDIHSRQWFTSFIPRWLTVGKDGVFEDWPQPRERLEGKKIMALVSITTGFRLVLGLDALVTGYL